MSDIQYVLEQSATVVSTFNNFRHQQQFFVFYNDAFKRHAINDSLVVDIGQTDKQWASDLSFTEEDQSEFAGVVVIWANPGLITELWLRATIADIISETA